MGGWVAYGDRVPFSVIMYTSYLFANFYILLAQSYT